MTTNVIKLTREKSSIKTIDLPTPIAESNMKKETDHFNLLDWKYQRQSQFCPSENGFSSIKEDSETKCTLFISNKLALFKEISGLLSC